MSATNTQVTQYSAVSATPAFWGATLAMAFLLRVHHPGQRGADRAATRER